MRGSFLCCISAAAGLSHVTARLNVPDNPYEWSGGLYVNPTYQEELQISIDSLEKGSTTKTNLEEMTEQSSAYWIDKKSKVQNDGNTSTVLGILEDAYTNYTTPPLVTFIVYDLPNRDCNAYASNGEICCTYNDDGTCDYTAPGECEDGISEYTTTYIKPFAEALKQYDNKVPVVLVIEPDSLPNLATNAMKSGCGNNATAAAYTIGITTAVKELSAACPNSCSLYLDAAHGGWLGWPSNLKAFKTTVEGLDIFDYIRGFATNTANYQPLGTMCEANSICENYAKLPANYTAVVPLGSRPSVEPERDQSADRRDLRVLSADDDANCCYDPCGLLQQGNPANNEYNYATQLVATFKTDSFDPHVVIDTGRNGEDDMRSDCSNWCNIRNAGVGSLPTTKTDTTNGDLVDALYWLKTPGESDGCTQTLPSGSECPRFDTMCASVDSIGSEADEPEAPEAGAWFDYQIKQLADNAVWAR